MVADGANLLVSGGFISQKVSNAGFDVFLNVKPKQTVEQTLDSPVIWDAMARMCRHCNVSLDHH